MSFESLTARQLYRLVPDQFVFQFMLTGRRANSSPRAFKGAGGGGVSVSVDGVETQKKKKRPSLSIDVLNKNVRSISAPLGTSISSGSDLLSHSMLLLGASPASLSPLPLSPRAVSLQPRLSTGATSQLSLKSSGSYHHHPPSSAPSFLFYIHTHSLPLSPWCVVLIPRSNPFLPLPILSK